MASLELPFGINVLNPTSVDAKYLNDGIPYTGVTQANTLIPSGVRHIGLTVNINNVEYWYETGTADIDLVEKGSGSVTGATGTTKEVVITTGVTVSVLNTNINTLFVASGTTTYNLPATPVEGSEVVFVDGLGTAGTTPITIDGGAINIYDLVSTTASINSDNGSMTLVYNGLYWNVTAFV